MYPTFPTYPTDLCTVQKVLYSSLLYTFSVGGSLRRVSHAWKQRDMGGIHAWKPTNLTTGRGWGPVEHSNPCRRTFADHYPPRKHPQPIDADLPQTQVEPIIFTRQSHGIAPRPPHYTPLTCFIQGRCLRAYVPTAFHGKRQRGLPGHGMQQLPIPGLQQGVGQASSPHCQGSQLDSPLYNMRICASFSASLLPVSLKVAQQSCWPEASCNAVTRYSTLLFCNSKNCG